VMVVLVPTARSEATGDDLVRALTQSTTIRRSRTVTAVLLDQPEPVRLLHGTGGAVPAYSGPHAAARALAHAAARGRWLAQPSGPMPELPDIDTAGAHALVDAFLAVNPHGGRLDPEACCELLDRYGIPRPSGARAELEGRFGGAVPGVLSRRLAESGIVLSAGITQDDVFGPLIVCGPGGTASEPAARLAPLTEHDVRALLADPRCSPLLGRRGAGAEIEGLRTLLLRLSRMAEDLPQLAEAVLDAVVAGPRDITTLNARIRLLPRRVHDPYLRRLR
ncbi:acetate--CoA ligase family protein, partial [Streptomyces sp. H39-S7]|uniref:acetate--CoA ligase family protein n=1 Tax=Streptomyces sp. H39-S7 TaxID=3004357 RepID=UPI0022AFF75A